MLQTWKYLKTPTRHLRLIRSGLLIRVDDKNSKVDTHWTALYGNWLLFFADRKVSFYMILLNENFLLIRVVHLGARANIGC